MRKPADVENREPEDELRPEYEASVLRGGVRGKYAKRSVAGSDLASSDPPEACEQPQERRPRC